MVTQKCAFTPSLIHGWLNLSEIFRTPPPEKNKKKILRTRLYPCILFIRPFIKKIQYSITHAKIFKKWAKL